MSNGFDFYEGPTTDSASCPRITVRRGGLMVLTRVAVEMLGDGISHIQIGFNPETRAIGLRAAGRGTKGSYSLREQKGSVSRLVDGKRVFAHHGLTVEKAQTFDAQDFGDCVVGFVMEKGSEDSVPAETPTKAPSKSRKK